MKEKPYFHQTRSTSSDESIARKSLDDEREESSNQNEPSGADANIKANANANSPRHIVGNSINAVTDLINDNIIAARYGTFASISLLTAFGMVNTPLFFRFKRISDITPSLFKNRKTIHGRIVHVIEKDLNNMTEMSGKEVPIICLVHHLSPIGRFLNRSAFELTRRMSPNSQLHQRKLGDSTDLLKIEIAGIKAPPSYDAPPGKEGVNDWLKSLAISRATVSCTLLSRRKQKPVGEKNSFIDCKHKKNANNANVPTQKSHFIDPIAEETAICKINYRPGMNIFSKDLGLSLVSFGRANVASGMHIEEDSTYTYGGSENLIDIETDVKYLEELAESEFNAVKDSKGMWSLKEIRNTRADLVEEADFDLNAGFWSKMWKRFRRE